eukprot:gene31071-37581_t
MVAALSVFAAGARGIMRSALPRCAGHSLASAAAAACTGTVKQQLTYSRTGNGWFTSVASERKAAAADTFPAALSYWKERTRLQHHGTESGMMTYGDTRAGAVLAFASCAAPNATDPQPYLHMVWNATVPAYTGGAAVLR